MQSGGLREQFSMSQSSRNSQGELEVGRASEAWGIKCQAVANGSCVPACMKYLEYPWPLLGVVSLLYKVQTWWESGELILVIFKVYSLGKYSDYHLADLWNPPERSGPWLCLRASGGPASEQLLCRHQQGLIGLTAEQWRRGSFKRNELNISFGHSAACSNCLLC